MRIALVFTVLLAVTACGKKKPPQSPTNAAPAAEAADDDMKDKSTNREADDATPMKSADPCEGGE